MDDETVAHRRDEARTSDPTTIGERVMDEFDSTSPDDARDRQPVLLGPGEGRQYPMGRLSAVFKADGAETAGRCAISEWWLEPHTKGPGAHLHPDDDIFFVLGGTMSVRVGEAWHEAPTGSFVLGPGGTTHDFENGGDVRAGMLNISAPGGFEDRMPGIADWFRERPPADADC